VGGESTNKMDLGIIMRSLCKAVCKFGASIVPNLHYSFGDDQVRLYLIYHYLVFVLLYMLYIPSHEYFLLIDHILYLCRSGWFRISMEIDFIIHIL
jgi:hypothetical protein